jgi:hypothetical protein
MTISNAEKQRRFRDRNVIMLTRDANEIARQLISQQDDLDALRDIEKKLRKVASFVADHVRHPDRTETQRAVALGFAGVGGLDGPLPKLAAIAAVKKPRPDTSWRVEIVAKNGQRWRNGATFGTKAEAQVYADVYSPQDNKALAARYRPADILPVDGPPNCSIIRHRKGGPPSLVFREGECVLQEWQPVRRGKR